jgi:hypothetical protein
MKGKYNMILACIAAGIAISPFLAYRFRTTGFLLDGYLEEWFVSALKGGDGSHVLLWTVVACDILGLVVGLLLKQILQSVDDDNNQFKLTLLRTPIAAAILVPFGFATVLLVAYNHTLEVLDKVVWPEFYSQNWLLYSIAIGVFAAILAGMLNVLEHSFGQANILARAGILCCSPLAIVIGFSSMAGMIGCGLFGGNAVGRFYDSPIAGAWTGTCVAVVFLVVEGGIFWPAYFPMTMHGDALAGSK